jgi:hypothetical protein
MFIQVLCVGENPYRMTSTRVRVTLTSHTGDLQQICNLGFIPRIFLIVWLLRVLILSSGFGVIVTARRAGFCTHNL